MDISKQVCTIEQAKALRSIGVKQGKSAFAFIKNECHKEDTFYLRMVEGEGVSNSGYDNWSSGCLKGYSAFTVAELGQMLPDKFIYKDEQCFVSSEKYCNTRPWIAGIHTVWAHDKPVVAKKYIPADTEAEARAALLIYLIENNVIAVTEINQRLTN